MLYTSESLPVVPRPAKASVLDGEFVLTKETRIFADPRAAGEAAFLAAALRRATGFSVEVEDAASGQAGQHDIALRLVSGPESQGEEWYSLSAAPGNSCTISAGATAGLFRGVQTLLQLLPPAILGAGPRIGISWTMPAVAIEDYPRFQWRGAMLDCSRHFWPKDYIKKFIDLLALHKLNTFHWHLTDDQGWRLEIRKYPRLTEIGSRRRETILGHLNAAAPGDGIPHEGFYTQEDAREIVAYAAERHITVVPEIEMPGHSQAAIAAYPEFGCVDQPPDVCIRWGILPYIYNTEERTFEFLQDVLDEVLDIFPGTFIHVGGDEAVKGQWEASEAVRARMAKEGIKDMHALQSWFIRRIGEFLAARGRRLIGWDEILEGGLAPGATVVSWRGVEGGIAAAQAGHDAVMAPCQYTYFDNYQSEAIGAEPLAIGGFIPLEKVYRYEPVPAGLSAGEARHILGVQGQLWTEYIPTTAQLEYMAFPRLAALAEVGWSAAQTRDYAAFCARLSRHLPRLDILGTKYRPL